MPNTGQCSRHPRHGLVIAQSPHHRALSFPVFDVPILIALKTFVGIGRFSHSLVERLLCPAAGACDVWAPQRHGAGNGEKLCY